MNTAADMTNKSPGSRKKPCGIDRRCVLPTIFWILVVAASASEGAPINGSPADSISNDRTLRIVTINVWSGLDYHGTLNFGEYESAERRDFRFQFLARQLKELKPDIIFVQEANPVGKYSSALADSLDFDEVHQVCNAGLKILGFGLAVQF